jgi:hypothetical protein
MSSPSSGSPGGSWSSSPPLSSPQDPFTKVHEPRPSLVGPSAPKAVKERAKERGERTDRNGHGPRRSETTTPISGPTAVTSANGEAEWSRPRGDRPSTGEAVPRVGPQPPHARPPIYPTDVYPPVIYRDPWPLYWLYGIGFGFPVWPPVFEAPLPRPDQVFGDEGALKVRVTPRTAKVYVDGYFVGLVDDFDGTFQKLKLTSGRHRVEFRAEGYETAVVEMLISSGKTITFTGDMKRIQ